jgi:hypothetical protein
MKENGVLYIKASGEALASVSADSFVALDLAALLAILEKRYPLSDEEREAAFLADVQAAALPGQADKRASVETLLHALFPQRYVLHLHPTLINGLTCSAEGARAAARLFPSALWVPECRPGYTLARLLADRLSPERHTVLLQNHGVFFAADDAGTLDRLLKHMLDTLGGEVSGAENAEPPYPALEEPFTPDQIVYCGAGPELPEGENARALYEDARKIAAFAGFFGGPRPMSRELISFIVGWEAESYRKSRA